jgi:hypothetical protein
MLQSLECACLLPLVLISVYTCALQGLGEIAFCAVAASQQVRRCTRAACSCVKVAHTDAVAQQHEVLYMLLSASAPTGLPYTTPVICWQACTQCPGTHTNTRRTPAVSQPVPLCSCRRQRSLPQHVSLLLLLLLLLLDLLAASGAWLWHAADEPHQGHGA